MGALMLALACARPAPPSAIYAAPPALVVEAEPVRPPPAMHDDCHEVVLVPGSASHFVLGECRGHVITDRRAVVLLDARAQRDYYRDQAIAQYEARLRDRELAEASVAHEAAVARSAQQRLDVARYVVVPCSIVAGVAVGLALGGL